MIPVTGENVAEVAEKLKLGELPAPAKSLAEAMCRVMEQVGYVQKDKQMQGGGSYRYASVEAVIDALRPEMIAQGVVCVPVNMEPLTVETFEGKNGGRQNRVQLRVTFRLTHWHSRETLDVVTVGEAIDVGDKASNKAMTAARKYALILAFNIETGNDPDDTPSRAQQRAEPPKASGPAPAKDNPGRRAAVAQKFAQCNTRDDYLTLCGLVRDDVKAGLLSQADRDALAPVARETAARFPAPATA